MPREQEVEVLLHPRPFAVENRIDDCIAQATIRHPLMTAQHAVLLRAEPLDRRLAALVERIGTDLHALAVQRLEGVGEQHELGLGVDAGALHRRFADRGFEVLGFPCNQFGAQEPGDAAEIANFCSLTYDVTFPVFAKVDVNGAGADPLFARLKADAPGLLGSKAIKWNFTKFLVNREGKVVHRYAPTTKPEEIAADIAALL